ncbi:hypothetical protein AC579_7592 [Pseudocercospora musae]|uniref:Uncharacterized protein n=1 Tax=Pseudocercospora musae TaxID=113226 RepID=A0A139H3W3_9PEZI|nr:hypothetical protein AC579_7592 [Pseudocercospora musae]
MHMCSRPKSTSPFWLGSQLLTHLRLHDGSVLCITNRLPALEARFQPNPALTGLLPSPQPCFRLLALLARSSQLPARFHVYRRYLKSQLPSVLSETFCSCRSKSQSINTLRLHPSSISQRSSILRLHSQAMSELLSICFDRCPGCYGTSSSMNIYKSFECNVFLALASLDANLPFRKLHEGFKKIWIALACNICYNTLMLREAVMVVWVTRCLLFHHRMPIQTSVILDQLSVTEPHTCGICLDQTDPTRSKYLNHPVECHQCHQHLHLPCFANLVASKSTDVTAADLVGLDLIDEESGEIAGVTVAVPCPFCRTALSEVRVPHGLVEELIHGQVYQAETTPVLDYE